MFYTKEQALDDMRILWEELTESRCYIEGIPESIQYGSSISFTVKYKALVAVAAKMIKPNICPVCNFARLVYGCTRSACKYCILPWQGGVCTSKESVYNLWRKAVEEQNIIKAVLIAKRMVRFIERAIAREREKNENAHDKKCD